MKQENIRSYFKELHENKGVSYKFLAKKIGISVSHLSHFMKGERNLSEIKYNTALYMMKGGELN